MGINVLGQGIEAIEGAVTKLSIPEETISSEEKEAPPAHEEKPRKKKVRMEGKKPKCFENVTAMLGHKLKELNLSKATAKEILDWAGTAQKMLKCYESVATANGVSITEATVVDIRISFYGKLEEQKSTAVQEFFDPTEQVPLDQDLARLEEYAKSQMNNAEAVEVCGLLQITHTPEGIKSSINQILKALENATAEGNVPLQGQIKAIMGLAMQGHSARWMISQLKRKPLTDMELYTLAQENREREAGRSRPTASKRSRPSTAGDARPSEKNRCYSCGGIGHFGYDCPSKSSERKPKSSDKKDFQ